MKKLITLILAAVMLSSTPVFAATDERGAFGGITQGISLPKTTEQLLAATTTTNRSQATVLDYSEMVFLGGIPERFDGIITVSTSGGVSDTLDKGFYTVSYAVQPNPDATEEQTASIDRNITFRVNYRKVTESGNNQVILDYSVTNWTETIVCSQGTFTLVPNKSYFGRSIIKDITPGVSYYKGQTSQVAYYTGGDENTTVEASGTVYGYDSPWSKTETERLNVTVNNGDTWQLEAQVRPSVSVNKVIQYSPNEPTAISFDGNYYEVTKNQSALAYNIFTLPTMFEKGVQRSGSISIPNTNKFEMLPAPNLAFLKGHFAEDDIKKLFAMQIFEGAPKQFQPAQGITRAQFVSGLVKAFKLPIEEPTTARNSRKQVTTVLFPDVQSNRSDFQYLMAAYKSGMVYGRYDTSSDNRFRPDDIITMEEAITILMRGLGLETLGLDPTTMTVFSDDSKISDWAKKEVSAAYQIGIIDMDANGNLNPQKKLTKAEAAAILNSLIDYMRTGLPVDYVEHILNFAD